jgi:hypothetical protein
MNGDPAQQLLRLRAIYAVVAGALILFALPLYEAAVLGPAGYADAVMPAVAHHDLTALLAWIAQHSVADRANRLLQLVPFLLAATLPGTLAPLLWPPGERGSWPARLALWAGRVGFLLFALAIAVGLLTSAAEASAYAAAKTSAGRSAAVAGFAASYAAETLLAQVLGGLLVAAFLALVSRQMRRAPIYLRGFGFLVAALAALNAIWFLADLGQVETPFSTGALFGLGLWLLGLGLLLPTLARAHRPQATDQGGRT